MKKLNFKMIEIVELTILLFFVVFFAQLFMKLDYSVRSSDAISTIFFNYLSMIVVSLIYFSVLQDKGRDELDKHAFMLMLYFASLTTCFEIINTTMDGENSRQLLLTITNGIAYIGNILLTTLYYFYIRVTEEGNSVKYKRLDKLVLGISIGGIIFAILNMPFSFLFEIDEFGRYVINSNHPILMFIAPISVLFLTDIPIFNGEFTRADKAILSCFKYIIIAVIAINILSVNLVLYEPAKTIGIFTIYCQFYIKHSRKVIEQQIELVEKQAELTKEQGNLMLSQIQPHFVYNGLLSIRSMIKRDPEMAEEALNNFMTYLIGSVNRLSSEELIELDDEVSFIETYLECQKVRYGDDVTFEIEAEHLDVLVPPITIQPLVESAVENSIRRSSNGRGHVVFKAHKVSEGALITIIDDGIGFDALCGEATNIEHMAIKHAIERLNEYQAELKESIKPNEENVLTVFIKAKEVTYE